MNLLGIITNFWTIITLGEYRPIDGHDVWEDSAIYGWAFDICYTIGTCSFSV